MLKHRFKILFFPLCLCASVVHSAELRYDSPHTFYSGREIAVRIRADGLAGKTLSWNLRYANSTAAAGEKAIPENGVPEIKFRFPELKPGITAIAELSCFSGDNKLQKLLSFHTENPFFENTKFLEDLKIQLWEPENKGNASIMLEKFGVPFSRIANFSEFTGKILIVSGIDFGSFSGLSQSFVKMCTDGARVIIVNPESGTIGLDTASFKEISIADNAKIAEFDKNFDCEYWAASAPAERSFRLVPFDGGVGIEIQKRQNGHTFMSAKTEDGELLVCSWDIFGKAGDSPTPAYLFEKLIVNFNKKVSK